MEGPTIWAGDDLRKLAWNFVAKAGGIAANENARIAFGFAIDHDTGVRRRIVFDEPAIDFAAEFPKFFADCSGKELFVRNDAGVGDGRGRARIVKKFRELIGAGLG